MKDFHAPPDERARSGFAAHVSGWSRTRLTLVTPLDPRLDALARTIVATNNMGGVTLAQLEIHPDPEVADYFAHNRIEADFFRHFFSHPDVLAAIGGLPPDRDALGFHRKAGAEVFETLVSVIRAGGAYRPYPGSEREARKLVTDFAAAVGGRFLTAGAWVGTEPWNGWFAGVAWDRSFFWFDRGTGITTVLQITDTD